MGCHRKCLFTSFPGWQAIFATLTLGTNTHLPKMSVQASKQWVRWFRDVRARFPNVQCSKIERKWFEIFPSLPYCRLPSSGQFRSRPLYKCHITRLPSHIVAPYSQAKISPWLSWRVSDVWLPGIEAAPWKWSPCCTLRRVYVRHKRHPFDIALESPMWNTHAWKVNSALLRWRYMISFLFFPSLLSRWI